MRKPILGVDWMSSFRTKRICCYGWAQLFEGTASAVMSLVDPKSHVSTQIQTVTIEELQSIPFELALQKYQVITTQVVEPALPLPQGAVRAALGDQPYWEVIDRRSLGSY